MIRGREENLEGEYRKNRNGYKSRTTDRKNIQVERISDPGANTSTQLPKLEYVARSSSRVEAATVIALDAEAGE